MAAPSFSPPAWPDCPRPARPWQDDASRTTKSRGCGSCGRRSEPINATKGRQGGKAQMATIDDILTALDAGQAAALDRLFAFLSIPSISAVPSHFPDCERAADWLVT